MHLAIHNLGKRYNRRWIFSDINLEVTSGSRLGITGHNGAGKSTLLKILTGALPPSAGEVVYTSNGVAIKPDKVYRGVSFSAPYTDLIEELTLQEMLRFHERFRPWRKDFDRNRIMDMLGEQFRPGSVISSFSSGMKQRVRLIIGVASQCELLCLDEPTSNLDLNGKDWYAKLIAEVPSQTTILIASNEESDMAICQTYLNVEDYSGLK